MLAFNRSSVARRPRPEPAVSGGSPVRTSDEVLRRMLDPARDDVVPDVDADEGHGRVHSFVWVQCTTAGGYEKATPEGGFY